MKNYLSEKEHSNAFFYMAFMSFFQILQVTIAKGQSCHMKYVSLHLPPLLEGASKMKSIQVQMILVKSFFSFV